MPATINFKPKEKFMESSWHSGSSSFHSSSSPLGTNWSEEDLLVDIIGADEQLAAAADKVEPESFYAILNLSQDVNYLGGFVKRFCPLVIDFPPPPPHCPLFCTFPPRRRMMPSKTHTRSCASFSIPTSTSTASTRRLLKPNSRRYSAHSIF